MFTENIDENVLNYIGKAERFIGSHEELKHLQNQTLKGRSGAFQRIDNCWIQLLLGFRLSWIDNNQSIDDARILQILNQMCHFLSYSLCGESKVNITLWRKKCLKKKDAFSFGFASDRWKFSQTVTNVTFLTRSLTTSWGLLKLDYSYSGWPWVLPM